MNSLYTYMSLMANLSCLMFLLLLIVIYYRKKTINNTENYKIKNFSKKRKFNTSFID